MVEAPEQIGLVEGPFGYRLWNKDGDSHKYHAIRYVRSDLLASLQKELAERTKELDRAKAIISKACNHLPNGAFCSPQASLDFMEHIPDEVLLVTSRLIGKAEAAEARADALAQEVERLRQTLRETSCPRPCNGRPDDLTAGQCFDFLECGCHIGAALGDRP